VGWLKIDRIGAASRPCWSRRAWPKESHSNCRVQRCQGHDGVHAIAALRPSWASETTSSTPVRSRATNDLRTRARTPRFGLADVEADDLPAGRLMNGVRDDHALRHDATAVPDLLDLGVEEEIEIAGRQGALAEGLDLLVEQAADARDLRARSPQRSDSTSWSTRRVETPQT
jgi:hypothetical protein